MEIGTPVFVPRLGKGVIESIHPRGNQVTVRMNENQGIMSGAEIHQHPADVEVLRNPDVVYPDAGQPAASPSSPPKPETPPVRDKMKRGPRR